MAPVVAYVADLVVTWIWEGYLTTALYYVAASAASTAISRSLAKKPPGSGAASALDPSRTLNVRDAAGTRKFFIGSGRIGGNVVFITQTGTNKEYTHCIIVHAANLCSAFQGYYLGADALTLDGSGNVTSPAQWAGLVRIKTHLGSPTQTVDTDLQADVGTGIWDNNHKLQGLCYSYVRYKTDSDVFSSGLPTYTVDLDGALCYDPRTSTTIFTRNSALLLRWYLTLDRNAGGGGVDSARIDDTMVIAAANICDEAVSLAAGGTEARYEASGIIDTASEPGQIVQDLCASMAGVCPFASGMFRMRAGAHPTAVMDLTDDDVIGPMSVDPRMSTQQACNGVKGVYVTAENDWQPGDFPPVKNDTYMAEDDGERIWQDIVLNYTTSGARAQRLAKIILERNRQDISHTFPTRLKALNLIPGDVVTRTSARYGWSAKEFEVVSTALYINPGANGAGPTLGVSLQLRETAAGVWDWSSGEETTVDLAPNTTLVDGKNVPTPAGLSLSTSNFQQVDGTTSPRLHIQWTAPADALVTSGGKVWSEYKKSADSNWIPWSSVRGDATEDYITDVLAGVAYDVRLRFENRLTNKGSYCTPVSATVGTDTTAPATPSGLSAAAGSRSVGLNWTPNTESDFDHYELLRNTSNTTSGAVLAWSGKASQYADYGVDIGGLTVATTYYYFLKAVDTSGNKSAATSSVNAAPNSSGGSTSGSNTSSGNNTSGNTFGTGVTLVAVTATVDANIHTVLFSGIMANGSGGIRVATLGLFIDGVQVGASWTSPEIAVSGHVQVAPQWAVTPGAGSHLFEIKMYSDTNGAVISTGNCSLVVL